MCELPGKFSETLTEHALKACVGIELTWIDPIYIADDRTPRHQRCRVEKSDLAVESYEALIELNPQRIQ